MLDSRSTLEIPRVLTFADFSRAVNLKAFLACPRTERSMSEVESRSNASPASLLLLLRLTAVASPPPSGDLAVFAYHGTRADAGKYTFERRREEDSIRHGHSSFSPIEVTYLAPM